MEGVTERNMAMCFVSSFLVYENEMVTEQNEEMEFSDFFEGVVRLSSWSLRAHQEREKAEEWAETHVEGAVVGVGEAEEAAEEEAAEEKAKGKGEEKGDESVEGTDAAEAGDKKKKKKKTTKPKAEKVENAGKPEAEEEEEGRHSRNKLDKKVGLLVPQGRRQSAFAKHLELAASSTTKAGKMSVAVLKVRVLHRRETSASRPEVRRCVCVCQIVCVCVCVCVCERERERDWL